MIYRHAHTIPRPTYLGDVPSPREAPSWVLRRLSDITVLMGKNGSGKSVLLRTWRDQNPNDAHYVVPERTGDLQFQAQFIGEEFDGTLRRNSATRNFVPEYRRRILSRVQMYFMIRGNSRSAERAPGDPSELERLIGLLVPEFEVSLLPTNPPYTLKRLATGEVIGQIDQLSSGEAQLLTMTLDIRTIAAIWEIEKREARILLLDEPDAHVHPDFQARFAEFLVLLVDRFALQVVVATHSTTLMAALGQFGRTRASVIYLDRKQGEYTARPFDTITLELASCLGGHILMGPLFGAPLLLVEGDDDYRIWSQVPRHQIVNVAVIPCNGEEIHRYQVTLERILSSLCEPKPTPLGYALLDGDTSLPVPSAARPQAFVKYLALACHEAENLYLTDAVLGDIGHTWESAREALRRSAPQFGESREVVENCDSWDRLNMDLKDVIQRIASVLDAKGVPWTVRVGKAIGRAKPAGELAEFLGAAVVDALWRPADKPRPFQPDAALDAAAASPPAQTPQTDAGR